MRRAEPGSGPPRSWTATALLGLAGALGLLIALGLGRFVLERSGNLAWDDAEYLRRGVRLARLAGSDGLAAVGAWLGERPRPPLLIGWIAASVLAAGRAHLPAVLVLGAVVPYALLLLAAARQAARLAGPVAAPLAVLAVAASPMGLAFGAKVMVETFLGLWVLLTLATAAAFVTRPGPARAAAFSTALGLAALTKLTVALLLPLPVLAVALRLWGDRNRTDPARLRATWVALVAPLLLIAGPWYARNVAPAVGFAAWSSRYNVVAEGRAVSEPVAQRLHAMADRLVGWPTLGLAVLAGLGVVVARRSPEARRAEPVGEAQVFDRLVLGSAALAAGTLLVPSYFDARFLLPIWPSLAVVLAGAVARLARTSPLAAPIAAAVLAWGLAGAATELSRQPDTTTYWAARDLIEHLVRRHGARTVANLGDCPDWNVSKTGLLNELRAEPDRCYVLYDLSRADADVLADRLGRPDALIVLDPTALPAPLLVQSPGLNRAYGVLDRGEIDAQFERLDPAVLPTDLPPMAVYVRRPRVALSGPPGPGTSAGARPGTGDRSGP